MKFHKGKLIVIDGGDNVGKATQADLLVKALGEGPLVSLFSFPRYHTVSGKLVRECLDGKHGDFLKLSPYLSSLPNVVDQAVARDRIQGALKDGIVVCDRYVPSNVIYQVAKLPRGEQEVFMHYLEKLQYDEIGMPRPDCIIYLSSSISVSAELMKGRDALDCHERSPSYQEAVVELYHREATKRDDWYIVDCLLDGELLSREMIHEKIMSIVNTVLTK